MGLKSFFESIGGILKKIFGNSSVHQTIKATLNVLMPVIVEVVSLALGPVAGTAAEDILSQIQTDFATLTAVAQGVTSASPTSTIATLNAVVASLKANLSALLKDAGVKNSAKFNTISADVNFFLNELGAIESALGETITGAAPPTSPAPSPTEAPKPAPLVGLAPASAKPFVAEDTEADTEQPSAAGETQEVAAERPAQPPPLSAGTHTIR
jgi:hypothetical protein